jgi:transmembrane protein 216
MNKSMHMKSILPLQILFYLNQWYSVFWVLIEILVFIFKGQTLPFASGVLAGEIVLFILLFLVDTFRIYFGTKGNLTERVPNVLISLIISLPCIAGKKFYIWKLCEKRAYNPLYKLFCLKPSFEIRGL